MRIPLLVPRSSGSYLIPVNIVHCCPADLPEKVFEHAATTLASGGVFPWVAMYSPWLHDDGSYKSASDEQVGLPV